jgi:hypothetical protein
MKGEVEDAITVGILNVLAFYIAQKLYPNNFALQAFVSGSLLQYSMRMFA